MRQGCGKERDRAIACRGECLRVYRRSPAHENLILPRKTGVRRLAVSGTGSETREFEWKHAGKNSERAREEENDDDNFISTILLL
jgi:hypothetical protein